MQGGWQSLHLMVAAELGLLWRVGLITYHIVDSLVVAFSSLSLCHETFLKRTIWPKFRADTASETIPDPNYRVLP